MKTIIHNILGTPYTVLLGDREEIDIGKNNAGECRIYSKKILVCTEEGDCTDSELIVKVQEIVAHEVLHAYLNEAGVDIDCGDEEKVSYFYMKNWRNLNNSILEILDKSGFLDN